jgi:hypothetical protein
MSSAQQLEQSVQPQKEQVKLERAYSLLDEMGAGHSSMSAFAATPVDTSFDFQLEKEEVLLLLRQHPVTQIQWILIAIILVFLPILFASVHLIDFLPVRFQIVAVMGWYLLVLGFSLEAFLDWFYNVNVVTNERVVDVDFNSLLFKNISTARLGRIEDISVTSKGYLGSIFDYGDIKIQTAGATDEFNFDSVPHPNKVSAFINELLETAEEFPEDAGGNA